MHNVTGIYYLCTMKFVHYLKKEPSDHRSKREFIDFSNNNALEAFVHYKDTDIKKFLGIPNDKEIFFYGYIIEEEDNRLICAAIAEPLNLQELGGKGLFVSSIYTDKRLLNDKGSELIDLCLKGVTSYATNQKKHQFDYAWFPSTSLHSDLLYYDTETINTEMYGTVYLLCQE